MPAHESPSDPPESAPAARGDSTVSEGAARPAPCEGHEPEDAAFVAEWLLHLERKEIARAIPKVLKSLERATFAPEDIRLPVWAILDLLAALAASGDAIRAKQLTEAMRRWVWVIPKAGLSPAEHSRWTLLDELGRIEPHLPHQLYQTFGRLIQSEDPELLGALSRSQAAHPDQARRDREWLLAVAPALSQAFGRFLEPGEAVTPRQERSARGWLALIGLIIALNVLRMFHESTADNRSLPEGRNVGSWGRFEAVESERTASAEKVIRERDRLIGWLRHSGEAHRAETAAEALLHGSCADASHALSALDELARRAGGDADESMRSLWTEHARKCLGRQHDE